MARVLFNETWFTSKLSQRAGYESEYEQVIWHNRGELFPRWIAVWFKTDVAGEDGAIKRPDLALIDHEYRKWWIVEIELSHHSLNTHVLPQVKAFRTACYTHAHANYLYAKDSSLDLARLSEMMLGLPPEVLVIADRNDTDWKQGLLSIGVQLCIVEPFRDPSDHLMLRVNGYQPEPPMQALTRCTRHAMRRLWRVHSPAALPPSTREDNALEIDFKGTVSLWKRVPIANAVMLSAERGDVLEGWRSVDLLSREDGTLTFEPVVKE